MEHAEQTAFPFSALVSRVQSRLRTIETQRQEAERAGLLSEAVATLESAKKEFLRTLASVRERVGRAPLNETMISPNVPIDNVIEAVGLLRIGGAPPRDLNKQVFVRAVKYYNGYAPGQTFASDWRTLRLAIWRGEVEELD